MKENDVISIESAETLLSHLAEAEDSGAIGDAVWCKVALSVLEHVLYSDLTPLCHEAVNIGIQKSARLISDGKHWADDGERYGNKFLSIQRSFSFSKQQKEN